MRDEENGQQRQPHPDMRVAREMTVAEYLDRAIDAALRRAEGLKELRRNLPGGYLERGCSTLAQALHLE